jgi:hypothetical protein
MKRTFKYSGIVQLNCRLHSPKKSSPDGALIPPSWAPVSANWSEEGPVPQYAPTVSDLNNGYNPAGDCQGYFMSYKYQPNNNCYAYGCNIATNSFPQPGRAGNGNPYSTSYPFTAENVTANAQCDGLVYAGTTMDDIKKFARIRKATTPPDADVRSAFGALGGHFVALMFSPPENNIGGDTDASWPGDYHWARCDDNVTFNSWSQKDGGDQVTNFDFAGHLISDPSTANWRVNQGPIGTSGSNPNDNDPNEYVVTYGFHCFMFVPNTGINII